MSKHYYGITDLGRVRDNNEDAFLVEELQDNGRILAAVIDGVGGYEGGEVAAGIAKDAIVELSRSKITDARAALQDAVVVANQRIIAEKQSQKGREKMACVLTVVLADPANNEFHYAHVGDTRLYLLRGQTLVKVSKDHSFVGFLEDSSRITEHDAMRHPKRNEVNKALGFDSSVSAQTDYIETGTSPFLAGDILLLCSDGLSDMIGSKEISDILGSNDAIANKAQQLIDAANNAGGRDNVTVVLLQNPKTPTSAEPQKPPPRRRVEEPPITETPPPPPRRNKRKKPSGGSSVLVWVLTIACVGLAAALIWALSKDKPAIAANTTTNTAPDANAVISPARNTAEQQLFDRINSSTDSLVLDSISSTSPVRISDTITISKDTFRFSGRGLTLQADSALKGPAFILTANAKYVYLEDLVFENFPIAILANSNALRLRNVRFINCSVPVSYQFHFPDGGYTRGLIHEGLFFKTDSIPHKL